MSTERRKHTRVEIALPATMITLNGPLGARTQNLSLNGTLIRCSEVPELDDNFRLVFKPAERQLLLVTAEMVWCDSFLYNKYMFHAMGIRFKYIPDSDRRFLSKMISKHVKLQSVID